MKCPKCMSEDLAPLTMLGVEMETCGHCRGCWLSDRELDRMTRGRAESHLAQHIVLGEASPRSCPKCKTIPMTQGQFKPAPRVIIDQCSRCQGMWLDGGELPM